MSTQRQFHFHASAHALSGELTRPVQRVIEVQGGISLPSTGGVGSSTVENFRIDEVISFKRGYSHVSGSVKEVNNRRFYTTHATATVEGLNILDVVTADRIVARLSSSLEVPQRGPLPRESRVLLVGSKFENLRIAGYQTEVELDHELFVKLETFVDVQKSWKAKLRQMARRTLKILQQDEQLVPDDLELHGAFFSSVVKEVHFREPGFGVAEKEDKEEDDKKAEKKGEKKEEENKAQRKFTPAVVQPLGHHAFYVVDFGNIYLSEILCQHGRKTLTMLRVELGCPTGGCFTAAEAYTNGQPPWG